MSGSAAGDLAGNPRDRRLIVRVWQFVRPHWGLLLLSMLLIPVAVAFDLAQPYLLKTAIDDHIAIRNTAGLGTLALLFLACIVLQTIASFAQIYTVQLVGQRTMHDLRVASYRHVITRRTAFYDRVPVGHLLTRLTGDIESINEMFAGGVMTLAVDVVKLVGIVAAMLYLDVKLTLLTFITVPVLLALVEWGRRLMRASARDVRAKLAAMNALVSEYLAGLKVVQLFCRERAGGLAYAEINAAHRDANMGSIKGDVVMYAMIEAIGVTCAAAIVWFAGASARDAVTVGLIVAFIEYANRFFTPIRELSAKYGVIQSALAAVERIVALLDTEEHDAAVDPDRPERTERPQAPAIELRDVHFRYRAGEPVLTGVDLAVERGRTVAIVGSTGAGKSTLIRLLARLYEPDAGRIYVNGRDIASWAGEDLRARMAMVSQDVFLFSGTIADNVRLGRLEATPEEIERALARVGADKVLARRGASVATEVGERGTNFSVGERQLISFARALIRDPEILVLDEATAHVDPETESAIERGVRTLTEGRTTIVIAHRLSTIRHADVIVVMANGAISEAGTHQELMARDGLFAQLERTFQRT